MLLDCNIFLASLPDLHCISNGMSDEPNTGGKQNTGENAKHWAVIYLNAPVFYFEGCGPTGVPDKVR